jgi:hypothetical protein
MFTSAGFCRNRKCVLGHSKAASVEQCVKIAELCEELGIDTAGKDYNRLTKDKASDIISKLIERKVGNALYGED